jgi:hypothetical protein
MMENGSLRPRALDEASFGKALLYYWARVLPSSKLEEAQLSAPPHAGSQLADVLALDGEHLRQACVEQVEICLRAKGEENLLWLLRQAVGAVYTLVEEARNTEFDALLARLRAEKKAKAKKTTKFLLTKTVRLGNKLSYADDPPTRGHCKAVLVHATAPGVRTKLVAHVPNELVSGKQDALLDAFRRSGHFGVARFVEEHDKEGVVLVPLKREGHFCWDTKTAPFHLTCFDTPPSSLTVLPMDNRVAARAYLSRLSVGLSRVGPYLVTTQALGGDRVVKRVHLRQKQTDGTFAFCEFKQDALVLKLSRFLMKYADVGATCDVVFDAGKPGKRHRTV